MCSQQPEHTGRDGALVSDVILGKGLGLGKKIREGENTDGAQLEASLPLPPPSLLLSGHSVLGGSQCPRIATGPAGPSLPRAQRSSLLSFRPLHGSSMNTVRSAKAVSCACRFCPSSLQRLGTISCKSMSLSSIPGHVKSRTQWHAYNPNPGGWRGGKSQGSLANKTSLN